MGSKHQAHKKLINKISKFCNDSMWSILALALMNIVAQFILYPCWDKYFGDEIYGNIIYCLSIINIFAVAIGTAINYSRMTESAIRQTYNGDYNIALLIGSILSALASFIAITYSNFSMSFIDKILASVLCVLTLWRYYGDVEYRLTLNYKGYFMYYLTISLGYLVGLGLFELTGYWALALMPGELFGLILIICKSSLIKISPFHISGFYLENTKRISILAGTNFISNIIFNGDRFLLQILLDGTAVSVYYLASLIGKTMTLITTPLNSVIIGYLSKYKGKFSRKLVTLFSLGTLVAIFLGTLLGYVGSYIVIKILYANSFSSVKPYFLIATLTQVIYFVTNIVTTVLLRMANANCQLVINVVYAVLFFTLCIPAVQLWGISGFCFALLLTNFGRYFVAIYFCYKNADHTNFNQKEQSTT